MRKKKIIVGILILSMIASLAACGKEAVSDGRGGYETSRIKEALQESLDNASTTEAAVDLPDDTATPNKPAGTSIASDEVVEEFHSYLDAMYKEYIEGDSYTFHDCVRYKDQCDAQLPEIATWGDLTIDESHQEEALEENKKGLLELEKFKDYQLPYYDQITYDMLHDQYETAIESADLGFYMSNPFSPNGLQSYIGTIFTDFRIDDRDDLNLYLDLMDTLPDLFDAELDYMRKRAEHGYFMSDANCDDVIQQCDDYMQGGDKHFLITTFDKRLKNMKFLTDAERTSYSTRNKTAVKNGFIPCLQKLKDLLTELKGTVPAEGGLCNFEGGKEYYEVVFRNRAGTSKSPAEMKDYLANKMEEHLNELMTIAYGNPEAYQAFQDLYYSDGGLWENDMEPSEMLDYCYEHFQDDFPQIGEIPYSIEYLDKDLWNIMDGILAYYNHPAYDDKENHIIRINGKDTDELFGTIAHEGTPGHMYQFAYFMSTDPHPIRDIYAETAYKEGWAMYTEYIASSYYDFGQGEYNATIAKLANLYTKMGYLAMAYADLMVNYYGWTEDDVADYREEIGFGRDGSDWCYNSVTGDPGTYQSYVVGYYMMQDLRDKAEREIGAKFDVVDYHKVILSAGPISFDMLSDIVDRYIMEHK